MKDGHLNECSQEHGKDLNKRTIKESANVLE